MSNFRVWASSGAYLPSFMRDFHSQKDIFKALHDLIELSESVKDINWVKGHIYTVDVFLWWMAKHGYTLQRCRNKQVEFEDLQETIRKNLGWRLKQLTSIIKDRNENDSGGH